MSNNKKPRSGQIRFYRPIRFCKGGNMLRFEFSNQEGRPLACRMTVVPALANMKGVNAEKGQAKYDYDNQIIIDLTPAECFKISHIAQLFIDKKLKKDVAAITHDPGKNAEYKGQGVLKTLVISPNGESKVFFRAAVKESGSKGAVLQEVRPMFDYWDMVTLAKVMDKIGFILLGLEQPNITAKFDSSGGNITETFSKVSSSGKYDAYDFGDIPLGSNGTNG